MSEYSEMPASWLQTGAEFDREPQISLQECSFFDWVSGPFSTTGRWFQWLELQHWSRGIFVKTAPSVSGDDEDVIGVSAWSTSFAADSKNSVSTGTSSRAVTKLRRSAKELYRTALVWQRAIQERQTVHLETHS
jgi:hypothetical protein